MFSYSTDLLGTAYRKANHFGKNKFLLVLFLAACLPCVLHARKVKLNSIMQPWEFKVTLPFTVELPDSYAPFHVPAEWGTVYWADKKDILALEENGGMFDSTKMKRPVLKMYVDQSTLYSSHKNEFSNENPVLLAFNKAKGGYVKDREAPTYGVYRRFSAKGHEFFLLETADRPGESQPRYKVLHMALKHNDHVWTVVYLNYPNEGDSVWRQFLRSFSEESPVLAVDTLPDARMLEPKFKDSEIFRADVAWDAYANERLPFVEFAPGEPIEDVNAKLRFQPHGRLTFQTPLTVKHRGVAYTYDRLLEYAYHKIEEKKDDDGTTSSAAVEWIRYRIFLKADKVVFFRRLHEVREAGHKIKATNRSINFSGEDSHRFEYQTIFGQYLAQRDRRWCAYAGLPDFQQEQCKVFKY